MIYLTDGGTGPPSTLRAQLCRRKRVVDSIYALVDGVPGGQTISCYRRLISNNSARPDLGCDAFVIAVRPFMKARICCLPRRADSTR